MKMRVAMISPVIERVPPKKYGGTERIVEALTNNLVDQGVDVTLFATEDSKTKAKLISVFPKSLRESKTSDSESVEKTVYHLGTAYSQQNSFDIIHDHNSFTAMPIANLCRTPCVITMHGLINQNMAKMFKIFSKPNYVSISHDQIKYAKNFNDNIKTIYNGLNFHDYPVARKPKDYLLFVGRISIEKGVHVAIEVAEQLDIPLIIAAKLDRKDLAYFKQFIEPKLRNHQIRWIGEVNTAKRNKLMNEAICLINPVLWREPFGLTMIEAMACGCPVIAFNNGSVPEIIADKLSGFIVKDDQEMIAAVNMIELINRDDCRSYAINNFNEKIMTNSYLKLYEEILYKSSNKRLFI